MTKRKGQKSCVKCRKGYHLVIKKGKAPFCLRKIHKCLKTFSLRKREGKQICRKQVRKCKKGFTLHEKTGVAGVVQHSECTKKVPECFKPYKLVEQVEKKPVCKKVIHVCKKKGYRLVNKNGKFTCTKNIKKCHKGFHLKNKGCHKKVPRCTKTYHLHHKNAKFICSKKVPKCAKSFTLRHKAGKVQCFKLVDHCTRSYKLITHKGKHVCHKRHIGKRGSTCVNSDFLI
jgi:hypothetical protein